jgi:sugar phosphate isomerase/epimerase
VPQFGVVTLMISSRLFARARIDDAIAQIASAGITTIEISADRCHLDPRLKPDVTLVTRALARHAVEVISVHLPYMDLRLGHPDDPHPRRFEVLDRSIRSAAEVGARLAVLHPCSFFDELPADRHDAARDEVRRMVERCVDVADRVGVAIVLENLVSYGVWRVGTSVRELAATFTDERVRFCFDVGHALIAHDAIGDEIVAGGARLALVHLDDNDGSSDQHLVAGEGVLDRDELETALAGAHAHVVHEIAEREHPRAALEAVLRWHAERATPVRT